MRLARNEMYSTLKSCIKIPKAGQFSIFTMSNPVKDATRTLKIVHKPSVIYLIEAGLENSENCLFAESTIVRIKAFY